MVPRLITTSLCYVQERHDPGRHISVMSQLMTTSLSLQIWSMEQPEWTCKIDEGSAGLTACYWTPDSRHILTMADFHLRLTLWSLVNKSVSYIKYPKLTQDGLDFTPDGQYMALAERRDCKDHISIFDCEKWCLVRLFEVATKDLVGIKWSPQGNVLCIWDSCLDYQIYLYTMDGHCVGSYSAYGDITEFGLGVKSISWSPTGQFLAVGSFDEKVRLLNHITWKTIAEYHHPTIIENPNVVVYNEVEQRVGAVDPEMLSTLTRSVFPTQSKFETQDTPVQIASVKPDPSKANPKVGIKSILFSSDNRYMATQNDNMPSALWIWNIVQLSLAVILTHTNPIRDCQWDPVQNRLAICTNTGRLYMWSPAGCVSVVVPSDPPLTVQRLQWHPTGSSLALIGSTHFCVCYLTHDEQ